jgi:hypothetical protein
MSVPEDQAGRFLAPLRGRLTVLMLHDSRAKIRLARFVLACARLRSMRTAILDTDAFYCANLEQIIEDGEPIPAGALFLAPEQDFGVGSLLPLLSSATGMLIVDDLNSLQSLASGERSSQQLAIIMRLLSHNAKANSSWAIATVYGMERTASKNRNPRSLASFGDILVEAEFASHSVELSTDLKGIWPNGKFTVG